VRPGNPEFRVQECARGRPLFRRRRCSRQWKGSAQQVVEFLTASGIAWDPKGNGRMTIRSSYGLFRDYPEFYKFQLVRSSPPWTSTVILQSPTGGFEDPWQGYPGGSPFPVVVTRDIGFPTSATWVNVPLDLPSVYVNQWNLSVQRQIGANWLVSANYIGNSV